MQMKLNELIRVSTAGNIKVDLENCSEEEVTNRRLKAMAVFPSLSEAGEACVDLKHIGVPQEDISLIAGNEARLHDEYLEKSKKASASTAAVAAPDAALGGGMGILAMLIAFAIPGVGPIVALGPMLSVRGAMGIGVAAGGLIGAFHNEA